MDTSTVIIIVVVLLIIFALVNKIFYKLKIKNFKLVSNNATLDTTVKELKEQLNELEIKYIETSKNLDKTIHQKKSSEVRLGKTAEQLIQFTDGWPWPINDFRFLGSPVDGFQLTNDRIYLIEIKTGKARLSKKQTLCKELVKRGKISFISYRINETGTEIIETEAFSE